MYGIVNKGIREMVISQYGLDAWKQISVQAGCEAIVFTNMHAYDDSVTYDLVGAAAEVLDISAHEVLVAFGEYWISYTAQAGYGAMLSLVGNSFPEFLKNLDNLHLRVGSTYRELDPPSFKCTEIDETMLVLEYHSNREGLSSLVLGLLQGLAKSFSRDIAVKHTVKRTNRGYDEFVVQHTAWKALDEKMQPEGMDSQQVNNESGERKTCPFSGFGKSN